MRWSAEFLVGLTRSALLRYLAVAHDGRGRGDYVQSEHPSFWKSAVARAVESRRDEIMAIWGWGERPADLDRVSAALQPVLTTMAAELLAQFYPENSAPADGIPYG